MRIHVWKENALKTKSMNGIKWNGNESLLFDTEIRIQPKVFAGMHYGIQTNQQLIWFQFLFSITFQFYKINGGFEVWCDINGFEKTHYYSSLYVPIYSRWKRPKVSQHKLSTMPSLEHTFDCFVIGLKTFSMQYQTEQIESERAKGRERKGIKIWIDFGFFFHLFRIWVLKGYLTLLLKFFATITKSDANKIITSIIIET